VLFVVLVGSGFVPDIRLAMNLREARAAGLLTERKPVSPAAKDDAKLLYDPTVHKFAGVAAQMSTLYPTIIKRPAPQMMRYLNAMREAAERPSCSAFVFYDTEAFGARGGENVLWAAKAWCDLAKDADDLVASANMARHLALQGTVVQVGRWGYLVERITDRAKKLGIDPAGRAAIKKALGPPIDLREVLRGSVATSVGNLEREVKMDGRRRASATRDESAGLAFWIDFFKSHPAGPDFAAAVRANNEGISQANVYLDSWFDPAGITGTSPTPWATWADIVEKGNRRAAEL